MLSLYDATVPPLSRGLNNLSAILAKGAQFAGSNSSGEEALLSAKLAADMFPLSRQVQIACDTAKSGVARLAGADVPSHPDTETSFAELQARIQTVTEFVNGFDAARLEGGEDRVITLPVQGTEIKLPGRMFLFGFVFPNFYFHLTTAYAILRHQGVELGKRDFLGGA